MYSILIVEDDHDLADIANIHLTRAGYSTSIAHSCAEADALLELKRYDLILLDMLLPDDNGGSLCKRIRATSRCPIIFMSCLDDSDTIVKALSAGGDDYVVKPVEYNQLLARIEANIRRAHVYKQDNARSNPNLREYKHFTIDTLRHRVRVGDSEVDLSSIEYALLLQLVDHPNTLMLYDDLYRQVWTHDSLGDVRTVMVHISNLRKKIDPGRVGIIETVRGAGYIFSDI